MIVQGPAASGRSLMVSAEGRATVLHGAESSAINHRLRAKYIKPEALGGVDRAWGGIDDITVEIEPTRWRSWTGSALHERTQEELNAPYAEAWLADER
jgi:hypothetical protein